MVPAGSDGRSGVVGGESRSARTQAASVSGTATVRAMAGIAMPESFIRNPMSAHVSAPISPARSAGARA